MKKKVLALLLVVALVASLAVVFAGCDPTDEDKVVTMDNVKIGMICLHDENSTYDKNFIDAMNEAAAALGLREDQVIIVTGIPESDECYQKACELADEGCDIIFANSFGHEDYMIKAAKEAVKEAIKTPLSVTQSTVTTGTRPDGNTPVEDPTIQLSPADFIEADTALAAQNSIDLSKYTLLEWNYLENTYWNSTSKATTTVPKSTAGTYLQNICCDRKYTLSELPLGTIFIVDDGWQYRLEGFVTENAKYTGKRPGMITQNFFVLDANFVNDMQFLVWNVASEPKSDISKLYAQAACHLRIYVPNGQ